MYLDTDNIHYLKNSEIILEKIEKIKTVITEQGFTVKLCENPFTLQDNIFHVYFNAELPFNP